MKAWFSLAVFVFGVLTFCRALEVNRCTNRFTCRDGSCGSTALPQADRCNSFVNCEDGSDEAHCDVCPNGFYCDSGECLTSVTARCDDVMDCRDGSDEDNCKKDSVPLSTPAIIGISIAALIVLLIPVIICNVICCCVIYSMLKTTSSSPDLDRDLKKQFDKNSSEKKENEAVVKYALTEIPKDELEAYSPPPHNNYKPATTYDYDIMVDGVPLGEIEAYSPPPQAYDPPLDENTRFGRR